MPRWLGLEVDAEGVGDIVGGLGGEGDVQAVGGLGEGEIVGGA